MNSTECAGRPDNTDHIFVRVIDEVPVRFVRPDDTELPTWVAYTPDEPLPLGVVHARDTDGLWHVQSICERHHRLDDAVRALRRPQTWTREREQSRRWADQMLRDPDLVVFDVQTTGLGEAWAVQIAVLDRNQHVLLNEQLNPLAAITEEAAALHGITAKDVATAPTFDTLLPKLTQVLHGRRCLAYNLPFDQGVVERELRRHDPSPRFVQKWISASHWEDAIPPYAVWKGYWLANQRAYRYPRLSFAYEAVTNCHTLLAVLEEVAGG